MAQDKISK